jgi:hypothetical protein
MITGLSGYNEILSKKIKTEFHSAMSIRIHKKFTVAGKTIGFGINTAKAKEDI